MSDARQQINTAIAGHAVWKVRLESWIDAGKVDMPLAQVKVDNACPFGQWLHSPASDSRSPHHKAVLELHKAFHEEAAKVADAASKGKKAEGKAAMAFGGPFINASSKLTLAMMAWLKAI